MDRTESVNPIDPGSDPPILREVEGPSAEQVRREWEEPARRAERADPFAEEQPRFTLREVFLAATVLAVGLAVARVLPPAWLALVIGVTTLVLLVGYPLFDGDSRVKLVACLILLALYGVLALAAVLDPLGSVVEPTLPP